MGQVDAKRGSFFVQMINAQNTEWQGTVTWANGKESKPFRSMLELLTLMERAMDMPAAEDTNQSKSADISLSCV